MKSESVALLVLPTSRLGGAETVTRALAAHLLQEGYRVVVYAMSRGFSGGWDDLRKDMNFCIIEREFNSEKSSLLSFVNFIRKFSRENIIDVVWSTHLHVNAALSVLRRLGVLKCRRLIIRESTVIFERFVGVKRLIFRLFYDYCYGGQDLVVFQTAEMRSSLFKSIRGSRIKNSAVVPNPVDVKNARLKLAANPPVLSRGINIVACGRLEKIKGFDSLILAFDSAANDNAEISLFIIGDGSERGNLQSVIGSCRNRRRIHLIGYSDNPYVYLKQADIGVVSSIKEGFPNVLLEMMVAGVKMIITTPCSGGVFELPGVLISEAPGHAALRVVLDEAIAKKVDNSRIYQEYVSDKRSVHEFWSRVSAGACLT